MKVFLLMSNKRHAALTSTYTSYPQFMSVLSQIKSRAQIVIHRRSNVALTSTYALSLDSRATLQLATRSPKGMAQAARLVLMASLLLFPLGATANAEGVTHKTNSIDHLKLYAHSRIINYEQFNCFDSLITRESHWNVKAKNGSHYGLGQMRNAKYRVLDGFTQVDWSIRYITKRYGSMCNGWRFFKAKGYH
jgi:hypothetical protein